MASYPRRRIRCKIDVSDPKAKFIDVLTGAVPAGFRGTSMQFELGFFYGNELLNIANFNAIQITVKDAATLTGAALMSKTIGAASMNASLTQAQWDDQSDQHAIINFLSTETALGSGGTDVTYFIVVHGLTNASVDKDTFQTSTFLLKEDGTNDTESPPIASPTTVTLDQLQAILQQYVKEIGGAGRTATFTSANGLKRRIIGVDNDGIPIDVTEDVT